MTHRHPVWVPIFFFQKMNYIKSMEGVYIFKGKNPGKIITVIGGTHGNEACGVYAIQKLQKEIQNKKISVQSGELRIIYGNPKAIQANVRFCEKNLNRMFVDASELSIDDLRSYERKRAEELMPYLQESDALLDIHSSLSYDSTPFVICEPRSFPIAKKFNFPIISSGWDKTEPGGTDYFVNKNNGFGICAECGSYTDPHTNNRAYRTARKFLNYFDIIPFFDFFTLPKIFQQKIQLKGLYKTKENFRLSRQFADFESIKTGTLIGTDGTESIKATIDGYIIFARDRKLPNEDAFLIGTNY